MHNSRAFGNNVVRITNFQARTIVKMACCFGKIELRFLLKVTSYNPFYMNFMMEFSGAMLA